MWLRRTWTDLGSLLKRSEVDGHGCMTHEERWVRTSIWRSWTRDVGDVPFCVTHDIITTRGSAALNAILQCLTEQQQAWCDLQVEGMSTSVETAKQIASKMTQPNATPGAKLSSAMQQDNERFIGTETDRQQMVMRWAVAWSRCPSLDCTSIVKDTRNAASCLRHNACLCYLHGYIQATCTNAWLMCVFLQYTVVHNFAILVIQAARWGLGSAWRSCSANRAHGFANTRWAARAKHSTWTAWRGCGRNHHQASCSSEEDQYCAPKSWLERSTNDHRHPDPPFSHFDNDSVQLMLVS